MKSGFITHQGKQIIFLRYDHLIQETLDAEIHEAEKLLCSQPENSILLMVDFNKTLISPGVLDSMIKSSLKCKKYFRKNAVLGIEGVRSTLLDIFMKATGLAVKSFPNEEAAKAWLIQ
jgi:hypothetical protein